MESGQSEWNNNAARMVANLSLPFVTVLRNDTVRLQSITRYTVGNIEHLIMYDSAHVSFMQSAVAKTLL